MRRGIFPSPYFPRGFFFPCENIYVSGMDVIALRQADLIFLIGTMEGFKKNENAL